MFRSIHRAIFRRFDPVAYARYLGVQVGSNCRLLDVEFGSEPWLIKIGDHVSISGTQFITHDGGCWVFRMENSRIDWLSPVVIGNNVFIGSGSIILPGVKIGDNVVIGAGSVVATDIPSDCVAVGVPARRIRGISEYRKKIFTSGDETKLMSRNEKRRFYSAKYSWLWMKP